MKFQLLFKCGFALVLEVVPALLFLMLLIAQVFSTLIYIFEPRDNIHSLPESLWFVIITMSTVGYGEIVPMSAGGKCTTLVLVICSTLYLAVPVGIVGSAFNRVWEDRDRLLLIQQVQDRLQACGLGGSDIPGMFADFGESGENGDGVLTFCDFQNMVAQMHLGIPEEKQVDLFESFDGDNSGTIEAREFVRVFCPKDFLKLYGQVEKKEKEMFLSRRSLCLQQRRVSQVNAAYEDEPMPPSPRL